jgi:hypothetical protein
MFGPKTGVAENCVTKSFMRYLHNEASEDKINGTYSTRGRDKFVLKSVRRTKWEDTLETSQPPPFILSNYYLVRGTNYEAPIYAVFSILLSLPSSVLCLNILLSTLFSKAVPFPQAERSRFAAKYKVKHLYA